MKEKYEEKYEKEKTEQFWNYDIWLCEGEGRKSITMIEMIWYNMKRGYDI